MECGGCLSKSNRTIRRRTIRSNLRNGSKCCETRKSNKILSEKRTLYVMIRECKNNVLILRDKFSAKYKTKTKVLNQNNVM